MYGTPEVPYNTKHQNYLNSLAFTEKKSVMVLPHQQYKLYCSTHNSRENVCGLALNSDSHKSFVP